ncbi:glycosyl hydrolase family 61-domain-containing protein [Mycena rosella]|uniref:AA9 family lytic polysaccharide monooxygenase n=1 Tax=Mycena rosella TaxID=1033263 RepID=A0AAD7GN59_MYCRO|nr:glycosyl hydrolase family 61-domain-containing protein [Mycena rosella]
MFPLFSLLLLLGSASAGTVFSAVSINGVEQGHGVGVRVPTSNVAITDLSSANLICNSNYVQPVSQAVLSVPAGAAVTAEFHRTAAGYVGPDPADPIDPTNKGPVIAYLAAVPSATQSNVTGLNWFKIWENGFNPTTHQWGSDLLFINNGSASFTVPSCLRDGDYLLRVEYIGLESATSYPGAQFFMSCAQLSITASGDALVAPATVSIPGMYHSTDPGIVTSIFGVSSYTVPGPAVFTC